MEIPSNCYNVSEPKKETHESFFWGLPKCSALALEHSSEPDYDGDEMNTYVPPSIQTLLELEDLCSTQTFEYVSTSEPHMITFDELKQKYDDYIKHMIHDTHELRSSKMYTIITRAQLRGLQTLRDDCKEHNIHVPDWVHETIHHIEESCDWV